MPRLYKPEQLVVAEVAGAPKTRLEPSVHCKRELSQ